MMFVNRQIIISIVGVLGQDWETAMITTRTPYKAFTSTEITAEVGMRIGLSSMNITLKG